MGCFSFKCKVCGKGIQSTSFSGQKCHLFLLEEGKVIQKMSGEYDSYGRVFIDNSQRKDMKHSIRESVMWDKEWGDVCNLMFSNAGDGIAAYHDKCYNGEIPTTDSESDPNQGWGEECDD